jgi:hypothetical protein
MIRTGQRVDAALAGTLVKSSNALSTAGAVKASKRLVNEGWIKALDPKNIKMVGFLPKEIEILGDLANFDTHLGPPKSITFDQNVYSSVLMSEKFLLPELRGIKASREVKGITTRSETATRKIAGASNR